MKIQAAVVYESGQDFQMEEMELSTPKQGEILVKVVASGVCHTDKAAQYQHIPVPLPVVLGHEGAGIIEEVGEGVNEFKKGDRVVFSFGYCGACENCLNAKPFACERFNEINFGGVMPDGTKRLSKDGQEIASFFAQSSFATYAITNVNSVVKVTDNSIDLALLGPLGCGIQTGAGTVLNRLKPRAGSSIVVFGCGTVGLSSIMAAKLVGCGEIIAIDRNPKALELATELGATHAINTMECSEVLREIKNLTNGGAHFAVDTTGVFVKKSLASIRSLGTAVVLGVTGDVTINVQEELMGESKSLIGVIEGDSVPKLFIPQLIEYYKAGKFPIDKLVKFYDFKDINQAFKDTGNGEVIKAILRME